MIGDVEINLWPLTLFFGFMATMIVVAAIAVEKRRRERSD